MLTTYPAIFYEEAEGGYTVYFPDLNQGVTCGDNYDDAFAMAVDYVAFWIWSETMDGKPIPSPSDPKNIDIHELEDDEWQAISASIKLISVDVKKYAKEHFEAPVKITVTLPLWMRDTASVRKISFSKTLTDALRKKLTDPFPFPS